MRVKKMKIPKYRILTLDAKELYELQLNGESFNIYADEGGINYTRFNSFLYNSLEVEQLKLEYEKAKAQRKLTGKFEVGKYVVGDDESGATLAVINVTFEKDLLEFNKKKSKTGYVYLRVGYQVDFATDLTDHICIRDGKLIAIEVPYESDGVYSIGEDKYKAVETPCDASLLGKLFEYNGLLGCYMRTTKAIPVKLNKKELRKRIYKEGFMLDGKKPTHFVRYKRSAGSSRQGNCLFIAEPLYKGMMKWSACGLDLDKVKDQISKESYISLTLSNMEKEIEIPLSSVAIIPDAKSIFNDKVVFVEKAAKDGKDLIAQEKEIQVENKIWDGQGLLDVSVFTENGYEEKGMMLLRNRFFKTCAFNTNLQSWFKDNGITSVSQLNGNVITRAEKIEDIKLIVTDSSVKYIKLYNGTRKEAINAWLDNVTSGFGLVKTEKPTKHMYGNMVQTSYQLLNTLELDDGEVKTLLNDSLEYLWNVQSDPMFMRHYIKMQLGKDHLDSETIFEDEESYDVDESYDEDESYDGEPEMVNSMRKNVIMKLLSLNDRFADTKEYSEFRTQTKKAIIKALRQGHLLVQGTNATLFGNGAEMLYAMVNQDYDFKNPTQIALKTGEIRNLRFDNNKELLCARSPHITMGNLYVCKNAIGSDDIYSKYFNLTPEIVCVNSINENLLQRLNGCDFDSDMMLITDNETLLKSAKKNYKKFLVPYCGAESTLKTESMDLVDNNISNNKIGEIVNLSQRLNSIYWDRLSKGVDDTELYLEICKLAVLSGMEIDRAKRDYGIQASTVLNTVRKITESSKYNKPEFFKYSNKKKTKKKIDTKYDGNVMTTMQRIVNVINAEKRKSPRTLKSRITTLSGLLPELDKDIQANDYRYKNEIIDELNKKQDELSNLRGMMFRLSDSEKTAKMYMCREIENYCVEFVHKKMKSKSVLYLLIGALDDESSKAQSCRSLLLSTICSASDDFYKLIANTRTPMYQLEPDNDGEYVIYGYNHTKRLIKQ